MQTGGGGGGGGGEGGSSSAALSLVPALRAFCSRHCSQGLLLCNWLVLPALCLGKGNRIKEDQRHSPWGH